MSDKLEANSKRPQLFKKGERHPNQGRGCKEGAPNAGRPPDAFKAMCRGLASSAEVEKAVRQTLNNPDSPAFMGALKWASEHGYGRPDQGIDLSNKDGSLLELLKSLKA